MLERIKERMKKGSKKGEKGYLKRSKRRVMEGTTMKKKSLQQDRSTATQRMTSH